MKIRTQFIAAAASAVALAVVAVAAIVWASGQEERAETQQLAAQQVARDLAGLVGATHVFQKERDELSVGEWQRWHATITRNLQQVQPDAAYKADVDLVAEALGRLPALFARATDTAIAPSNTLEQRRRDQAFELLLGDTQAMADAAFRWAREAGAARQQAERIHNRIVITAVASLALLLLLQLVLALRNILWPLEDLNRAALALEQGAPVPLIGNLASNELGVLARRFDAMNLALARRAAELREAERKARAVADSIPVLVKEFDADGKVSFVNAHVERVYGQARESFIGQTLADMRGPEAAQQLKPYIARVLAGEAVDVDSAHVLQGQPRHFNQRYVPRVDADGKVDGFYSVSIDITERKLAELRTQRSEERMRRILANAPDAFISTDPDGYVTEWNRQAEQTFGWSRDEVLGEELAAFLVPPAQRQAYRDGLLALHKAAGGAALGGRRLLTACRKDGGTLPVEVSIAALSEGERWGAIAFLHDITERTAAEEAIKASERRLRNVTDAMPALVGYFDRDEVCQFANGTALRAQGLRADQVPGITLRQAIGEDSYAQQHGAVARVLAGKAGRVEGRLENSAGAVYFQSHFVPDAAADGGVAGFYVMTFDITPLKRAELLLAANEKRLRAITDNLPVLIAYIDRDERVLFVNQTFNHWTGQDHHTAVGKQVREVLGEALYDKRAAALREALDKGHRVSIEVDTLLNGRQRVIDTQYIPDLAADGRVLGVYALSTDVTSQKLYERQLANLARTDTLTGLPNRQGFNERLLDALRRSARHGGMMALLFLDVDKFKGINDTHGHGVGDEVLREFASRLSGAVRSVDTVARLAGDEFVIILEKLSAASEAELVAAKILQAMAQPIPTSKGPLAVGTSIGIATHAAEHGSIDPGSLTDRADQALYQAKEAGRNRYRMYGAV